jgi:eukaryotic-like serine/threonine-protein kinase
MTAGRDNPAGDPIPEAVSQRFSVERLIATGGMANIYEARDRATGRVGALKLLRPHSRRLPDAVERLSREASAATRISDPHIVQTLDAGTLPCGEPYVFMELLNGEPLDQLLARRKRLPILEALELVAQAARGLCAAHAMKVLHRDIKPGNLFLSGRDPATVKLLDFGVSKLPDRNLRPLTREGFALGTFSYMPPEQMMSARRVDERADIYSLGVVLYQCVAGKLPFTAKNTHVLMASMQKNEYTKVSLVRPDAPRELDAIIERSVRANPDERYATAQEMHDALVGLCDKTLPQPTLSIGEMLPAPARLRVAAPPSRPIEPPSRPIELSLERRREIAFESTGT